ncbi:MAG: 2Fe-2S iron-sulfur cluster binding domain-containing protein [Leptospiraceae bacterium]|nr:2Fe-2S iron-sulfur cluster binding domain-containing protein [Leptospiraceae bacterium]
MIQVRYDENTVLQANDNETLLEVSLKNNIEHIHACGGNARCSTCRVLVLENPENLGEIEEAEKTLIQQRGFEKGIRLGCQAKIKGNVSIRLLVKDTLDYEEIKLRTQTTTGREDNLAILFSDIRSFTSFSERNLPYDIIHLLNRYFEVMGQIVLDNGGYLDKYIGDGLMANFGLKEKDPVSICVRAVNAALQMLSAMESINSYAKKHLNHDFKIGIGIHYGNVIVGEVGHHSNAQMTLIGDAVNEASRVESMTKKAGVSLLISQNVYEHVKKFVRTKKHFKAPLKGKTGYFHLFEIESIDQKIVQKYVQNNSKILFQSLKEIATGTYCFEFNKPPGFHFEPGQFVELKIEYREKDSQKIQQESRAFSIASNPEESVLRFVTRNTKSEYKLRLLQLEKGAAAQISEPAGDLAFQNEEKLKHVFIAGGIGVTPFYSIITHQILSKSRKDLTLIVSAREAESLIFHEEFETLDKEDTGFRYCPSITGKMPKEWPEAYETGHIDLPLLRRQLGSLENFVYYVAGSTAFVDSMKNVLTGVGVLPIKIHQENFYGY